MRAAAGIRSAAAFLMVFLLGSCSGAGVGDPQPANGSGVSGTLTVFAAASLKSGFTEIARRYEDRYPGAEVTLSFAGSADLATQISQGAPADVFAAADANIMDTLREAGLVDGEPLVFATNTLAIAVPPGNPANIQAFADLARPGTRLVQCARQVPCGAAAAAVARQANVDLKPVSEENSVTDVLGKVVSGEADAGLVYATDIQSSAGKAEEVPFPEAAGTVNRYPLAVLSGNRNGAAAQAFVDLLTGPEGQQVLAESGFGAGSE